MAKIDHISYGGTNYEIVPAAGDLRDIVAPEFSDQSTYTAGQMVLKNGVLYKFTAAHSGAWTGTDAVEVTVGGELTRLDNSSGSGLTDDIKQALLTIAEKVAYIDDDGQDYYDALYDALYPPIPATAISLNTNALSFATLNTTQTLTATLTPSDTTDTVSWLSSDNTVATVSNGVVTSVGYGTCTITATAGSVSATCSVTIVQATLSSISAIYTQSGTVYDTDSLDDLKADLVVTGLYDDQSTETITNYTLSGTLEVGTSTITVSYGGKTTTFNVTVTEYVVSPVMSATQGNITSGSMDADKVTVVLNKLTFAPSEVKTISVDDGYQFFAFRQYGVADASNAGTVHGNNQMNVYSIGNNGYVQKMNEANDRILISDTNSWETSKTYTNTNSSITQEVTGIGIYIKTTDGSALTPEQAVNVFSISLGV